MSFIEQVFGVAPDGGTGSLEYLVIALPISVLVWLAVRRVQRVRHARRSVRAEISA